MYCQGFVKQKDGTNRPCGKQGNAVMSNGYCVNHQYFAVLKLMQKLQEAKMMLSKLDDNGDLTEVQDLRRQIGALRKELDGSKQICSEDRDCDMQLREILINMKKTREKLTTTAPPEALVKLETLEGDMKKLGVAGTLPEAEAFDLTTDYELRRRQQTENKQMIDETQAALYDAAAKAEQQESMFQSSLKALTLEAQKNELAKLQSQQIVDSLQKRLDRSQAESKQVSGVYSTTINKLQEEVEKYKELYNNMVARELRVGKSLDALTQSENDLKKSMAELKQNYEIKLQNIRNEFAEKAQAGGMILSEREEELNQQVERLKSDLELAVESLKMANEAGKEALNRKVSDNEPYGRVAQELIEVNNMLRMKNQELSELQARHDQKIAEFANAELKTAQRIDQASARDRAEIQKLSRELNTSERKVNSIQQEIVNLQTTIYNLKRQHQNETQQISNKLHNAQNQLMQIKAQREAEQRNITAQKDLMRNQINSIQLENNFKFTQLKEKLQQDYDNRVKILQDKFEANQLQLQQERSAIQAAQKQISETAQTFRKQKETLEQYRSAYEQKMAQFNAQKDGLSSSLAQAREQANQFTAIEDDYKKRVAMLKQTVAVQRQRYEARMKNLTAQLNQAVTHRNQISIDLEKCNAAREGIVARVNQLSEENARLKDQFLQIKSRMDLQRASFESHMEKLRADNARMQSDVRTAAQRLRDCSLVHEHVTEMKQAGQRLRANLEETILKAKGNAAALQRVLKDKELEHNQVIRLQNALRDCAANKTSAQATLDQTNAELRTVKRMNTQISGDIRHISDLYQRNLNANEAKLSEAELSAKLKEESLMRQLSEVERRNKQKTDEVQKLQKSKSKILDVLADTELNRAREIDLLVAAQRDMARDVTPNTGKSNLVHV